MAPVVMRSSLLIVEGPEEGICRLKLNRPEKRNALSIELREALTGALRILAADAACRAIILAGEGRAFCGGMDFAQFGGDRDNKLKLFHSTRDLFSCLLQFPRPVIAAVHGAAVGGGFTLALCCDARIAAEDAFFGFFEVKRGIPAPFEVIRLFVDAQKAKEWCETGRRIEVSEALEARLVKQVVGIEELAAAARREAARATQRRVSSALRAALEGEMGRFERALFPEG
jgi:enoyl-CoA hydratase/carnithine racemase